MDRDDPDAAPAVRTPVSTRASITLDDAGVDLPLAYELLDRFATANALDQSARRDLNVVVDEIVSNIAKYAYAEGRARIVRLSVAVDDATLRIIIEDDGVPFDPLSVSAPDTDAQLSNRAVGGLGIHLVRQLMDKVAYSRVGASNRLVISKRLVAKGGSASGAPDGGR